MKLCPKCLISFDDEKRFCSECGTELIEDPDAKPAEPEKEAAEEKKNESVTDAPEVPAKDPTEHKKDVSETEKAKPEDKPSKKSLREAKKEERRREKEAREAARRAPIGAGRRILAVLLCVFLFVFAFAAAVGAELRLTSGADGMKAALKEIDLGGVRIDPFFEDVDEEMTVSALLSEDMSDVGIPVSEKTVTKILRNSTIKSFLAEQVSGVLADVYSGRSRYEFDPEELADELMSSKNAKVFDREGISLSRNDAEKIADLIDGYGLGQSLNLDEIKEELPELYQGLHFGLSYFTLGGLLVLILLLAVLIFKANKGRAGYSFGDIGGVLIAVGAILSLAALLAKLLPDLWQTLCLDEELIAMAGGAILFSNLRVSLGILGGGVVLAVLGRLLRGRRRPKEPAGETA